MIRLVQKIVIVAASLIVALIAFASIGGGNVALIGEGRDFYTSPVMLGLWALFAVSGILYLIIWWIRENRGERIKGRGGVIMALHGALFVVGVGAMITHFCGREGTMVVRADSGSVDMFLDSEGRFCNVGTSVSFLHELPDGCMLLADKHEFSVRVNHPAWVGGVKLCVGRVSDNGAVLLVSADRIGTSVSYAGYLLFTLAGLLYLFSHSAMRRRERSVSRWRLLPISGVVVIGVIVTALWVSGGRPPMASSGEALLICSLGAMLLSAVASPVSRVAFLLGLLLGVVGVAMMRPVGVSLPPALDSGWIVVHVAIVMMAYALFLTLGVMGVMQLCGWAAARENLARRLCGWGVVLLGIGIFCGAVWANQAWGRYWGWDPKETWALLTLAVYALPLHLKRLSGRRMALYFTLAPIVVAITFFGVSYLGPSLHAY